MMNRREEIKKENKKAIPLFVAIILIAGLVGALLGGVSVNVNLSSDRGILGIDSYTVDRITLGVMILAAICTQIGGWILYFKCKNQLQIWDGEDDEIPDQIEQKADYIMWGLSADVIVSFACFALLSESLFQGGEFGYLMIMVLFFLIITFMDIIMQQKLIDLLKEMNPEKNGSVYDVRFTKKWIDSCDEAERLQIYQSGWTTYRCMNSVYPFAWLIAFFANFIFHAGAFSIMLVSILWLLHTSIYCYKATRLSR